MMRYYANYYSHLFHTCNTIALAAMFVLLASAFALGQCTATNVNYDPVDISEMKALQKQKAEVETSNNYVDILYVVMKMNPVGYRLVISQDWSYKLTEHVKENTLQKIRSGSLTSAEIERLKNINLKGETNFLGKCKGVTSSESAECFIVKKIGITKLYSLDGELLRILNESKDETISVAYCFELLTRLIEKKN